MYPFHALMWSAIALAGAPPDAPPASKEPKVSEPTQAKAAGPVVELMAPSVARSGAKVGESFQLVLSFENPGSAPVSFPINSETVRLDDRVAGGAPAPLEPRWSMSEVSLEPGALAAAFGSVTPGAAGTHTISLWFDPSGAAPTKGGAPTSSITIEVAAP